MKSNTESGNLSEKTECVGSLQTKSFSNLCACDEDMGAPNPKVSTPEG